MSNEWRTQGVPTIRASLDRLELNQGEHARLLLQRYLQRHKPLQRENQASMPEEDLLDAVQHLRLPDAYQVAFQRWQEFARKRACCFTMALATPLAIGLGNASPLEVGLTLHHTYGMPLIPGSALKGLCRRGAHWLSKEGKLSQQELEMMFGTGGKQTSAAGCVVFYDAWYATNSANDKPFHRDVITVHHPAYYASGQQAPTDFDDPNPVPFLVVKPKAQFLFAIDATTEQWAKFAEQLLRWCLQHLGVGAKTNAGYGYFAEVR